MTNARKANRSSDWSKWHRQLGLANVNDRVQEHTVPTTLYDVGI